MSLVFAICHLLFARDLPSQSANNLCSLPFCHLQCGWITYIDKKTVPVQWCELTLPHTPKVHTSTVPKAPLHWTTQLCVQGDKIKILKVDNTRTLGY